MTGPTLDSEPPNASTSTDSTASQGTAPRRRATRTGNVHAGLVIAAVLLVLLVIFLAQNAHTVTINFLGAQLHVSLAVALLAAALVGALIVGAAGTARIAQLRLHTRRAARRDTSTSQR